MPIEPKLLEVLRCPVTKQSLSLLTERQLREINQKITSGDLTYVDGTVVDSEISEGLITNNGNWIYRIDSGIPIMLQGKSIAGSELGVATFGPGS